MILEMITVGNVIPPDLLKLVNNNINEWKCKACGGIYPIEKLAKHLTGKLRCPNRRNSDGFPCPENSCKYNTTSKPKTFKVMMPGI